MSSDICVEFGKRIRKRRKDRGWSQEEFAFRVGMDISYLSEVENGKKEPCLRKIEDFAKSLDLTVAQLVRGL